MYIQKKNTLKNVIQIDSNNNEIIEEKYYFDFEEKRESQGNNLMSISLKKI